MNIKNKKMIILVLLAVLIIALFFIFFTQTSHAIDCCDDTTGDTTGRPDDTTGTTGGAYCGDGYVDYGEQCEYPNTNNNAYCSQTTSTCLENKTGTRDDKGSCDSSCQCVPDSFSYSCIKNSCGAECSANSDCTNKCVGNVRYHNGQCGSTSCACSYTTENCNNDGWYNTTQKQWIELDVCREKEQLNQTYRDYSCTPSGCIFSITNWKWVDTGNVRNKPDGTVCGSNTTSCLNDYCLGLIHYDWIYNACNKLCSGGVCGSCNTCTLTTDTCNPSGCCDATCDSSLGCGLIQNNNNCPNYCSGSKRYFSGSCGISCNCSYSSEDCNNYDGWVNITDWICNGNCQRYKTQEYRDYYCSPNGCGYTVTSKRNITENAPADTICYQGNFVNDLSCSSSAWYCSNETFKKKDYFRCDGKNVCNKLWYSDGANCGAVTYECQGDCYRERTHTCEDGVCNNYVDTEQAPAGKHCVDGVFTNIGYCGSSNSYCSNDCSYKIDRYECSVFGSCNQFDYSDTANCPQNTVCSSGSCVSDLSCNSQNVCKDVCTSAIELFRCNGAGTCNSFWKYENELVCNPYKCLSNTCSITCSKLCGANCEKNSDCVNFCLSNVRYYNGNCGSSCSCSYSSEDCNSLDGWYNTSSKRTIVCPDDECQRCQQIKQQYRDYSCAVSGCKYTITNYQWITVSRSPGKCCQGNLDLFFKGDPYCPNTSVRAAMSGLSYCNGKIIYLKEDSCSGQAIGSCRSGSRGCGFYFKMSEVGTRTLYACIDKNNDGDFNDVGEQSSEPIEINCNYCTSLTKCNSLPQCNGWCSKCGGANGKSVNQFYKSVCLNPSESCQYSYQIGWCAAK